MRKLLLLPATLALILLAAPGASAVSAYREGEVLVKYRDGASASERAAVERDSGTDTDERLPGGSRQLQIEDGDSVSETVAELRQDPDVAYAVPNYVAHASAFYPNDPGFRLQWNFREATAFGIDMPNAWEIASQRGAPGGRGAVVAVLDTGVAYRTVRRRFRKAPDLGRFVPGYDFVSDDRYPFDMNGHGTHVAGTIAQVTNNRSATAGIAYGARIMPLRVLDSAGAGDTVAIARAIRFAAKRRVDVINLSLEFDWTVRGRQIPDIVSALRYARRRGVTVVGAAGNQAGAAVAFPAREPSVIAVAGTTATGCEAEYSNAGAEVDVAAPGGGTDAPNEDNPWDLAHCRPDVRGRFIYQQTFTRNLRRFGLPGGYEGTSMSAPHVAGIAALIIATRRLGPRPSPVAVEEHLERTAQDLGPTGFDTRYGYGLVNAAAALR